MWHTSSGQFLVQTLNSNKSKYSIRQYSNAKNACALQDTMGKTSTEDFANYIESLKLLQVIKQFM